MKEAIIVIGMEAMRWVSSGKISIKKDSEETKSVAGEAIAKAAIEQYKQKNKITPSPIFMPSRDIGTNAKFGQSLQGSGQGKGRFS